VLIATFGRAAVEDYGIIAGYALAALFGVFDCVKGRCMTALKIDRRGDQAVQADMGVNR